MPRADGSIVIDTKLDDAELTKGISRIQKAGDGAAQTLGKAFAGVSVAASVAAAAIGAFALSAVSGAEEDAAFSRQLRQGAESMGIFGDQADEVADRLDKLAGKQQYQLGIDENVIKASQAKLLTFKELASTADEMGGAFDRATQLTLDMAAKGFGSAESNAVQLGKALNDPIKGITALNRAGINFTDTEKAMIKSLVEANRTLDAQDYILSAIEKQVGGAAKAAMKASDQIKIAFGEIGDAFGMALLPLVDVLAPAIAGFLTDLQPLMAGLGTAIADFIAGTGSEAAIEQAAIGLGNFLAEGLRKATPVIVAALDALLISVSQTLPQMVSTIGALAAALIGTLAEALPTYVQSVIDAMLQLIRTLSNRSDEWLTPLTEAVVDIVTLIVTELTKQENIELLIEAGARLGGAIGVGMTRAILEKIPLLGKQIEGWGKGTVIDQTSSSLYNAPSGRAIMPTAGTVPAPVVSGLAIPVQSVNVTNNFNAPVRTYGEVIAASSYGGRNLLR